MRRASLAAVLAGVTLFGGTTTALAGGLADTNVTIKAEGGDFSGTVSSERRSCEKDRKIVVMRVRNGKDEKIAMDNASKSGSKFVWSTGNTGAERGRYYAKATKAEGCATAKSKVVRVGG